MNFNTWFETWPLELQIAFLGAPFVIALSGVAVAAYMAIRNLDEMHAAFPTSSYIRNMVWGGTGLRSRMMQVGIINGAVMWPNMFIRRGELDPDEVRNYPARLKRQGQLSFWLAIIGMGWLFLAFALFKLTEG